MVPAWGIASTEGARLYFERRGSGPALLLIAGGGGDCGPFGPLADLLAVEFTVLSYDRRGNSRSRLLYGAKPTTLAEQSADALAVLSANGFGAARVFGNSGGATVALDLAAHHPAAVVAVVAHEPPLPRVLADGAAWLVRYDELERVRQADGWPAALLGFLRLNKLLPPGRPETVAALVDPQGVVPPGPSRDIMVRLAGNWEYMLTHEVRAFIDYVPDLERIVATGVPVAPACSEATAGQYFHDASVVIARGLGVPLLQFSGGHTAPADLPDLFAPALTEAFTRL